MAAAYTPKQGEYLAFIYCYAKIHGRSPAESDLQTYFGVSRPAIHQMILTLERQGLIERVPGQARSIRLLLPRAELLSFDVELDAHRQCGVPTEGGEGVS
jgi:DNA-binding MarR family transcriptional regulator